jgi:nitronate monooxygenase
LLVFSDAINLRFADKAIGAGAHGVIAIGSGGGGHSGTINHLTLVASIRQRFDGTVVMAGAVSNGAAIRAAEILGADMAYIGTRFIASHESGASAEYKKMLVDSRIDDLVYTPELNGVSANWLRPSMRNHGLDPDHLPARDSTTRGYAHLPDGVIPWSNLWSAGQGVEHIDSISSVAEIVGELEGGYRAACQVPQFRATTF